MIRVCSSPGCTALVVGTRCLHHAKHGEHAELLALIENGTIPAVA